MKRCAHISEIFYDCKFTAKLGKTLREKLSEISRRILFVILRSYGRIWDLHVLTSGIKSIRAIAEDEKQFDLLGKRDAEDLRKFIERDSIVLDVGCGIGRIEKFLAAH